MWLPRIKASQTFTSGKLKELINLLVCKVERFSTVAGHQWRFQAQTALGTPRLRFFYSMLDAAQDHLAGGRAFARGGFLQAAM